MLLQNRNDLLFRMPLALHRLVLSKGQTLIHSGSIQGGNVTVLVTRALPQSSHPQGREARRPSGAGADQLRVGDQPKNRQGTRPGVSRHRARTRRRGDRVGSKFAALHMSARGTWRLSLRSTKFRRDWRYCGHRLAPGPDRLRGL